MQFYFPAAYAEIDWAHASQFQSQTLQSLGLSQGGNAHQIEKVARVTMHTGQEQIIHIDQRPVKCHQGVQQGAAVMLSRLLVRRFGELPLWAKRKSGLTGRLKCVRLMRFFWTVTSKVGLLMNTLRRTRSASFCWSSETFLRA
jgi:hypothetical protein